MTASRFSRSGYNLEIEFCEHFVRPRLRSVNDLKMRKYMSHIVVLATCLLQHVFE